MPEQLQFQFPSLDFPGRTTLTVAEIAAKLGWGEKHVADLIAEGRLVAIDGRGAGAKRSSYRIPAESYRDFILRCLTSPADRLRLLSDLPVATRRELIRELQASLSRPSVMPATCRNMSAVSIVAETPQARSVGNLF